MRSEVTLVVVVATGIARADVTDAQPDGREVDYERLLEIDPEAPAIRPQGEITPECFERGGIVDRL